MEGLGFCLEGRKGDVGRGKERSWSARSGRWGVCEIWVRGSMGVGSRESGGRGCGRAAGRCCEDRPAP